MMGCGWLILTGLDLPQRTTVLLGILVAVGAGLDTLHDTHDTFLLVVSVTDFVAHLVYLVVVYLVVVDYVRQHFLYFLPLPHQQIITQQWCQVTPLACVVIRVVVATTILCQ